MRLVAKHKCPRHPFLEDYRCTCPAIRSEMQGFGGDPYRVKSGRWGVTGSDRCRCCTWTPGRPDTRADSGRAVHLAVPPVGPVVLDRRGESVDAAGPGCGAAPCGRPFLLDEWQEISEVRGAIERAVDRHSCPGQFLLTGSVRSELSNEM